MKEEWLREERMERERLEAQLGGEQEQNRVSQPAMRGYPQEEEILHASGVKCHKTKAR